MNPILTTAAGNSENQDRGVVIRAGDRFVLCVADGAGGRSGGMEAAVMATEFVRQNSSLAKDAAACSEFLQRMDTAVAKEATSGETTCALAVVTHDEIFGASVGDSGIWLIPETGPLVDLTCGQQRKPFIGSGGASAVQFRRSMTGGILLLATDGLLKYTSAECIIEACRTLPTELAAQRLVELVRYPSGALPDDVTLILTKL